VATETRPPGRVAGATREAVLEAATDRFLRGQRIDILGLSTELGVSRPTIYRWFGSRDDLVAEALEAAFEPLVARAKHRAPRQGLATAITRLAEELAAAPSLRAFLEQEREVALRILTSSALPTQARNVATVRELIETEMSAGRYQPTADPAPLAYAVVRLVEAFLYNDAVAGVRGDTDALRPVLKALLGS
jgi:AcrR family transcriptional regulator